jgi:transcriptional regulator with XRE-family HTH domain
MITATQCKMARAALGWGVRDLALRAKIAPNTVARFETGKSEPNASTLTMMRQAFEADGIEFTNGDADGVRLHRRR